MNKKLLAILLFTAIFGQFSQSDINRISNEQLDLIRSELNAAKVNIPSDASNVNQIETNTETVSLETKIVSQLSSPFFGYNYFKRDINFFDNIPAPDGYKLGPGDEIIISLWGERNSRETFTIDKEGQIFYSDLGFINLSNMTLQDAEEYLNEEFSKIFSTLNNSTNPTSLKLSLGKLKSINVFFTGQIAQPGLNLIHPFSDVFTAIVQAGGVNVEGSLRNVQIIRSNSVIEIVDFYSFFISGKNDFSDLRLIDGDTIHIPNVENRITLSGQISNIGSYEFLNSELLSDIISYAGGLKVEASSSAVLNSVESIIDRTSDDNARKTQLISYDQFDSQQLKNGDKFNFLSISDVNNSIEILGNVKSPGFYPSNSSLEEALILSGGFEDPEFIKSINLEEIIVLRKDANQFYSSELITSFEKSGEIFLIPGDKILVYENINYRNNYTFSIAGEVNKPGSYPYKDGLTLKDALILADGVTPLSSMENITVFEDFSQLDDSIDNLKNFRGKVSNPSPDFELSPNSRIVALPKEKVIYVTGNVYNEGLIATKSKSISVSNAVTLAGGYRERSNKKHIYKVSSNGTYKKIGRFGRVNLGDTLFIPVKDENNREFDITAFVADLTQTLTNIAAILILVDSNDN